MPTFSIIIATHERPLLLSRAIASIQQQSFGLSQIIVVSDSDCAQTRDLVSATLSGHDRFLQSIGDRRGPSSSRNLGMRLADGDYFIFLDDDDAFTPDYLREIASHDLDGRVSFSNHHVIEERFVDGRSELLNVREVSLRDRPVAELLVKNFIPVHSLVYPRSLAGQIAFDDELVYEDWDFILQAMARMGLQHIDCFGPIIFNRHEMSRSAKSVPDLAETYRKIYARHPNVDPAIARARHQLFAAAGLGGLLPAAA